MQRIHIISLAIVLVGCADGDVQSTFFTGDLPESDSGTSGSNGGSTSDGMSASSQATMIDPTVGLSTGQTGGTSLPPMGSGTTDPTNATSSSGPGDTTSTSSESSGGPADPLDCSTEEVELIDLVNAYRMQNGLPAVPVNPALCAVAHVHAVDLDEQGPQNGAGCGLRSWSNAGQWSGCCYTEDLAEVQCMWDKPRELTRYTGNGVEAVAMASDPATALAGMQADSAGNAMILSLGIWDSTPWRSVGAAIHGGHAMVWFGPDPP